MRNPIYSVMFHSELQNIRVKVEAASIVDAIREVCDSNAIPYRSVLEAKKLR